jgi:hypothetical protein
MGEMMSATPTELLENFKRLGKEFADLANSVPAAQLNESPAPEQWSAAYIIHHMADGDLHFATRYLHILAAEKPQIIAFNEEEYPERTNYADRDAQASLACFVGTHRLIEDVLSHASPSDWSRVGIHFELGEVTLKDVFAKAVSHTEAHIGQLRETLG